ncbi:cobalamin adenosyltransferase [Lysobacteraceae bacterium NML91-0213]|nr:cobalamin adenosyltransferase [Xanthomonadaceae bacterium NML91-0213]
MRAGTVVESDVRRVIVLPGLWMPAVSMAWFAARLRVLGFDARTLGYRSIVDGARYAIEGIEEALRAGPAHLVGHSLGGVIALEAVHRQPALPVGRVVCVGSPLCGSAAARVLRARRLTGAYLGRSGPLLERGCAEWPDTVEVGMIAGTRPRGLGGLVARFDEPHDGTVAVRETRAPGLADHLLLPASHTGLMFRGDAAAQTARFLRTGTFDHAGPAPAAV